MVSLIIFLMAKSFVAGAVVSDTTDAYVPRIYSHSDRSLVDSSFTTIAGISQLYGGYNGDSILATAARLDFPTEIAFDKAGHLHFMDKNRIRRVDKDTGIITTVVGTGETSFNGDSIMAVYASLMPSGFTFDTFGDMFVSDILGDRIRKVTIASGLITTVAGNGSFGYNGDGILATRAILASPRTITSDSLGNLYFIDEYNYRIRKITRSTGLISTVVGNGENSDSVSDGFLATSGSVRPFHIVIDTSGNLYTTDRIRSHLLRVSLSTGYVTSVRWFAAADFFFLDALDNLYWSRTSEKLILKKPISDDGETIVATNVYSKGIYVDANGVMYISLSNENTIMKVVPNGNIASFPTHMPTSNPSRRATPPPTTKYDFGFLTVAGIDNRYGGYNGDGILATTAKLSSPGDVTFDGMGDMYIVDEWNLRVRKVDTRTGVISTVVGSGERGFTGDGSLATRATMSLPRRIIFDVFGDMLILDYLRVRKVTTLTGIITTVAGNGTSTYNDGNVQATSASIGMPNAISCDSAGNLYISDIWNSAVWKVDRSTGIMNVVHGNRKTGVYVMGGYYRAHITAMTIDEAGDLYLADRNLQRVMKVTVSTGVIKLFYPQFSEGTSMFLDRLENLYYADTAVGQIRKITKSTGVVTIVAKNQFFSGGISMDVNGNIYVAGTEKNAIFKVNLLALPEIVPVPTAAPTPTPTATPTAYPTGSEIGLISIVAGVDVGDAQGGGEYNGDGILATSATLWGPTDVAFDGQGNMYIADSTNSRIRRVDKSTGIITTIAGTGAWRYGGDGSPAILARINSPSSMIFDGFDDLFFSDTQNNRIRKITTSTGIITTVVGNGVGPFNGEDILGTAASVAYPGGLAFDTEGNMFYVDTYNFRIRKLTKSTGIVKTVAGNGVYGGNEASVDNLVALNAQINPYSMMIDAAGDLYFTSSQEPGICKLTMSTGIIKTIKIDSYPYHLFIDGFGNIYYSSRNYNDNNVFLESKVHKISASNGITTIIANRLEKFMNFDVDASGDIYLTNFDKNTVLKVSHGRSITAYPTHQPSSLSAPPTLSPVMITAPPTLSPVVITAPPTLSPVMITAPPSVNPTKPPLNKPSLRPHYKKPSRAPLGKPPRKPIL